MCVPCRWLFCTYWAEDGQCVSAPVRQSKINRNNDSQVCDGKEPEKQTDIGGSYVGSKVFILFKWVCCQYVYKANCVLGLRCTSIDRRYRSLSRSHTFNTKLCERLDDFGLCTVVVHSNNKVMNGVSGQRHGKIHGGIMNGDLLQSSIRNEVPNISCKSITNDKKLVAFFERLAIRPCSLCTNSFII